MSTAGGFLRTTLVGGILYLIPIVILAIIVGKALQLAQGMSLPIIRALQAAGIGVLPTPRVIAILLIVLFCLAAGLFARTAVAKRISTTLESKILGRLPGYALYKGIGESLAGVEPSGLGTPVMARIEDAWQIAMVIERLDDGLLAVFVPDVPQARSGALYFMTPDRVRPLDVPLKTALLTLRRMGVGSNELLSGRMVQVDSDPGSRG